MKDASANILFKALDDDPEEIEILEIVCKEYNISRYQLHTDEEDFFKNMNADINLCLIDHMLKNKTGVEITRRIKQRNVDNYVIISSLINDFDVAIEYLRAGADDWIKKYENDYQQRLVESLRRGFSIARDRINKAEKLKMLENDTMKSMSEISKLLERLNGNVKPNN